MLSTCNRTELYAVGVPVPRRPRRPRWRPWPSSPVCRVTELQTAVRRLLRRRGRRAHLRRGRRPGLGGGRGEPDPRPGPAALTPARPTAPSAPCSTRCSSRPSGSASGCRPRPAIGSAGRSLVTRRVRAADRRVRRPLAGRRVLVVGAGAMAGLAARTAAAAGAQVTLRQPHLRPGRAARRCRRRRGGALCRAAGCARRDRHPRHLHRRPGASDHPRRSGRHAGGRRRRPGPACRCRAGRDRARHRAGQPRPAGRRSSSTSASRAEVEDARALVRAEVADFLGLRRAAQVAPDRRRAAVHGLRGGRGGAAPARLPAARPRTIGSATRSSGACAGSSTSCCTQPTVRVQELAADPDAVDYAAALRELFALDPQTVAAVMSPEVPR